MTEAMWTSVYVISIPAITLAGIVLASIQAMRHKRTYFCSPRSILLVSAFLAAFIMFLGAELLRQTEPVPFVKVIIASHNAIRLFILDLNPFTLLYETSDEAPALADVISSPIFHAISGLLFLYAPCLTFELLLSFSATPMLMCDSSSTICRISISSPN